VFFHLKKASFREFFDKKNPEIIKEKIKSEIKFNLNKYKYKLTNKQKKFDYFLSKNLEEISLKNYGRTYYNVFIKTIVQKVLSLSPKYLPSIFHRNGLAPLYYPQTIIEGKIAPTINFNEFDPQIDSNLKITPNKMVEANVDIAMNINYGFGGHNSAVIFKKYKG
jgi:hypothetical protein